MERQSWTTATPPRHPWSLANPLRLWFVGGRGNLLPIHGGCVIWEQSPHSSRTKQRKPSEGNFIEFPVLHLWLDLGYWTVAGLLLFCMQCKQIFIGDRTETLFSYDSAWILIWVSNAFTLSFCLQPLQHLFSKVEKQTLLALVIPCPELCCFCSCNVFLAWKSLQGAQGSSEAGMCKVVFKARPLEGSDNYFTRIHLYSWNSPSTLEK